MKILRLQNSTIFGAAGVVYLDSAENLEKIATDFRSSLFFSFFFIEKERCVHAGGTCYVAGGGGTNATDTMLVIPGGRSGGVMHKGRQQECAKGAGDIILGRSEDDGA